MVCPLCGNIVIQPYETDESLDASQYPTKYFQHVYKFSHLIYN
jgi:hypothetical protein